MWSFSQGEILVLHHPTTISTKYQAMVHVGSVRQTASIIAMDKECLRTGDKATVHFRFIKHPEYLKNGLKMVSGIMMMAVFMVLPKDFIHPLCVDVMKEVYIVAGERYPLICIQRERLKGNSRKYSTNTYVLF